MAWPLTVATALLCAKAGAEMMAPASSRAARREILCICLILRGGGNGKIILRPVPARGCSAHESGRASDRLPRRRSGGDGRRCSCRQRRRRRCRVGSVRPPWPRHGRRGDATRPRWRWTAVAARPGAGAAARRLRCSSRQGLLERLDGDLFVHAGGDVGIGVGPGLGSGQRSEFGDDDAAREAGRAGIGGIDGGAGAGHEKATVGLQGVQAFEMRRAGGQALLERAGAVFTNDDVKHYLSSSTYFDSSMPWPSTKTSIRPMPPNSLKLTQTSVGKLKAITRFRKPMKMKKMIQDRLTLLQTASGRVNCSPSMVLMAFFFRTTAAKPMLPANTQ